MNRQKKFVPTVQAGTQVSVDPTKIHKTCVLDSVNTLFTVKGSVKAEDTSSEEEELRLCEIGSGNAVGLVNISACSVT